MRNSRSFWLCSSLVLVGALGCSSEVGTLRARRTVAGTEEPTRAPESTAEAVVVRGRLSSEGDGTVASRLGGRDLVTVAETVDVYALGESGDLVLVTQTKVEPGGVFELALPAGANSATGIFVMQVKNLLGAVVGSGVVNGLPAFIQAFAIDATIDTVTSFKTEILMTLAKKGVPGVQSYLNVINAYVDAQLANSIALVGVLTTDLTTLIKATSDAVIAAGNVIVAALDAVGIKVDLSALTAAQAALVSGINGMITNASGALVTNAKNLVASLEAASAKVAAPIDKAIFNAVVNGGAAFSSAFGSAIAGNSQKSKLAFSASKATFALETELSASAIEDRFHELGVSVDILDAVSKACAAFRAHVAGSASAQELEAAKAQFRDVLMGQSDPKSGILQLLAKAIGDLRNVCAAIDAKMHPLANGLAGALTSLPLDNSKVGQALVGVDEGTRQIPSMLSGTLDEVDAKAIADAVGLVEKVVAR